MSTDNKTTEATKTESIEVPITLTIEAANEIGGALLEIKELVELQKTTKLEPTSEAKLRSLTEFVQSKLVENANELLGCFLTIKTEYAPLCNSIAHVLRRTMPRPPRPNLDQVQAALKMAAQAGIGVAAPAPVPEAN
jgi:hypothetical protein